jgi:hypothetical protein
MGLGNSAICRVSRAFSFIFIFFSFLLARVWFPLYTSCMLRGALIFLFISLINLKKKKKIN